MAKEPEYWLLKTASDRVYYTPDRYVTLPQTSLGAKYGYKELQVDLYFWVEVKEISEANGQLTCRFFKANGRPETFVLPDRLAVQGRYWLTSIDFGSLGKVPDPTEKGASNAASNLDLIPEPGYQPLQAAVAPPQTPLPLLQGVFVAPVDELTFRDGYACWSPYLSEFNHPLTFWVKNPCLFAELNHLRPLVMRHLKTKTISLHLSGNKPTVKPGDEWHVRAQCPELEALGKDMVQNIRFEAALSASSRVKFGTFTREDTLLTPEQMLGRLSPGSTRKATDAEEKTFLEDLFKGARHARHLSFLSQYHCYLLQPVRVVLNGKGEKSFLFLLKSPTGYHFAWETFDSSHATYLWQVPPSPPGAEAAKACIEATFKEIEYALYLMRDGGRRDYYQTRPEAFSRVFHAEEEGVTFEQWLEKLHALIGNLE